MKINASLCSYRSEEAKQIYMDVGRIMVSWGVIDTLLGYIIGHLEFTNCPDGIKKSLSCNIGKGIMGKCKKIEEYSSEKYCRELNDLVEDVRNISVFRNIIAHGYFEENSTQGLFYKLGKDRGELHISQLPLVAEWSEYLQERLAWINADFFRKIIGENVPVALPRPRPAIKPVQGF